VYAAAASRNLVGAMSVQAILSPLDLHTPMCSTETCRRSWRVEMLVEKCSSYRDKLTCSSSSSHYVRILATTDLQVLLVLFAQMLRLSKVDCWSCPRYEDTRWSRSCFCTLSLTSGCPSILESALFLPAWLSRKWLFWLDQTFQL
jgi:hypothetical protein